jgi:hypothetical protein
MSELVTCDQHPEAGLVDGRYCFECSGDVTAPRVGRYTQYAIRMPNGEVTGDFFPVEFFNGPEQLKAMTSSRDELGKGEVVRRVVTKTEWEVLPVTPHQDNPTGDGR